MLKETLDRLQKSVETMIGAVDPDGPVEMTLEEFTSYVEAQISKAATDTPENRVLRLRHLIAQVEVAKNYEGPTPGAVAVQQYKDPGQQTHTTTQGTVPVNAPQASNYGANQVPPGVNGAGNTPPGGDMPPLAPAGGSGFASQFSKAMEAMTAKLDALVKSISPEGDTSTASTETETPAAEAGTEETPAAEGVAKSSDPLWPLDMNTPAAMKEEGPAPEDLEWGYDPGSPFAKPNAAE